MRLTFWGAAGEVTGSCYLLETARARVLVDFGIHQGHREAARRNRRLPPISPESLHAVIVTHAHLDHTGRLPLLTGACPRPSRARAATCGAPFYATPATIDLTGILLRDAAHIQESDAERENQRRMHEGKPPVPALFTLADAERALANLRPLRLGEEREVAPGVSCRFTEAGHILGAVSVALTVRENGASKVVVFSGDIGPTGAPLLRDPSPPERADVLILESTYGDRDHRARADTVAEFAGILEEARGSTGGGGGGGKVLIPSFAVGRTQELIYELGALRRGLRSGNELPGVYVDSPLAIEATALYGRHRDLFDDETWAIIRSGEAPLDFSGLRFTRTREQSAALNSLRGGAVVIAGAGMCTGGRILHHLKHNLWDPRTRVVFVGFQAEGTLGRRIVDGERFVRVMGELIAVKARVHTLGGFSAHAGRSELIGWASRVKPAGRRAVAVFLTHGEDRARRPLAEALRKATGWVCTLPAYRERFEL